MGQRTRILSLYSQPHGGPEELSGDVAMTFIFESSFIFFKLNKSVSLLELRTGVWVTERQLCLFKVGTTWVLTHENCLPGAPYILYRQLDRSETLLPVVLLLHINLWRGLVNLTAFKNCLKLVNCLLTL